MRNDLCRSVWKCSGILEIRLKYLQWNVNWMTVGLEIVGVVCYSKYYGSQQQSAI
jgi:hypothetical protein